MLVLYGTVMLVIIVALLMSNKTNPFSALTAVPLVVALIAGFGISDIEKFATEGLEGIASTVALQVFGILFFTVMQQTGVFDPVVERIVNLAGRNPLKITLATVLLTQIVALDGDGTATYLIVISEMLPLYRGLGMNPLVLATPCGPIARSAEHGALGSATHPSRWLTRHGSPRPLDPDASSTSHRTRNCVARWIHPRQARSSEAQRRHR